jgi:1-phosphofructokinase
MIHLVTLNPALDLELALQDPVSGKIGEVLKSDVEAGGKSLNVARFLRKEKIKFQIWLGTGGGNHPTHILYRSLLSREGLTPHYLSSKAPIRLNVVVETSGKTRKYNHPGFELDLTDFGRLDMGLKKTDLLVLTGRLPNGMNPELYGSWIRAFGRKGVKALLDTSGLALRKALEARPWFFKVNLFEFSGAMGRKFSSLDQITSRLPSLIKTGLSHGSVTNGLEGALLWNGPLACRVRSTQKIKNRIVVGAGDGFLAGYIKGLQAQKSFLECAKLACATGSAVAKTGIMGFDPGLVHRLLKSVKVTKL